MRSLVKRYVFVFVALAAMLFALTGLSGPATALTARTLTLAASSTTPDAGTSVTFSGTLTNSPAGSKVAIQYLSGSTWVPLSTTTTTTAGGAYSKSITMANVAADSTFTLRAVAPATSTLAAAVSGNVTITVRPVPRIDTTALPNATRAVPYATTLAKTGGAGTWSVLGLPAGLTADAGTGAISGTPSKVGTFGVYVTFTETSTGKKVYKAFSLTVDGAPLAITTATLPDATRGQPYSVTLAQNGGPGTWSSMALPAGLSLNAGTGEISGIPTAAPKLYSVFVGFTETATGTVVTKGFGLTIKASPVITTSSLPDGTVGTPYSQQLAQTGNAGTWSLTKGALPAGLTLSSSGLISGTPNSTGDYGITVTFTETGTGLTAKRALLLHVSAPGAPVITTSSLPDGTVGTAYAAALAATPGGGTWSVTYGSLPPGITLDGATGALSGTPTTPGDYLIQVTYDTPTSGNTKVFVLHVNPAPPA